MDRFSNGTSDSTGMSAEELRKRLYKAFREKGWEDSLKAQLRKKLVIELQQDARLQTNSVSEKTMQAGGEGALLLRAANSLIADHLKRCQYDYSLSVFLPESGTSKDKLFTIPDILDLLHVHPKSAVYRKLAHDLPSFRSKGVFWNLLCELAMLGNKQSLDKSIQVNGSREFQDSLEKKLGAVDEHFQNSEIDHKVGREFGFEERLLKIQRQVEAQAKEELAAQMLNFKTNELKKLELDEREKCRQEVAKVRKEMERTYQVKLEAVQEREKSASERLRTQQQMMERETYSQRQKLLEELQLLRQKECDLKREAEVNFRAARLEEDKRKAIEDNLKFRESAVANIEDNYEKKLKEQIRRIELDFEVKWTEKLNQMDKKEKELKDQKHEMLQEKLSMKRIGDELREKSVRTQELEEELKQLMMQLVSQEHKNQVMAEKLRNVVDYPVLKENTAVLKRELENTQMRLAETQSEQKSEKQRNEELLKQLTERMSRPSPELISLRGELERTRDELQQEKAISQQKEEHWKLKIQEESQRNIDMQQQLENQSKQMQEMLSEISNLRKILHQTQVALQNEVYRQDSNRNGTYPLVDQSYYGRERTTEDIYIDSSFRKSHIASQFDLGGFRKFEPMARHDSSGTETDSNEGDQTGGSLSFVEETKTRMRQLEQEAEILERNYQEFQQRMHEPAVHLTSSPYHISYQSQLKTETSQVETASSSKPPVHNGSFTLTANNAGIANESPFMGLMSRSAFPLVGIHPSPSTNREGDWLTSQKPVPYQQLSASLLPRNEKVPSDQHRQNMMETKPGERVLEDQHSSLPQGTEGNLYRTMQPPQSVLPQDLSRNRVQEIYPSTPKYFTKTLPNSSQHLSHSIIVDDHKTDEADLNTSVSQIQENQSKMEFNTHSKEVEKEKQWGENQDRATGDEGIRREESEKQRQEEERRGEEEYRQSQDNDRRRQEEDRWRQEEDRQRQDDERQIQDNERRRQGEYRWSQEKERQRLEEEKEQREWEERRRKKEEERKRKEEEAIERERQMLLQLQQEEQQATGDQRSDHNIISKKKEPDSKKEEEKIQDDTPQIDPMMQKYMAMVQQKRREESKGEKKQPQRQDTPPSDHLSLGSMSADELQEEGDDVSEEPKSAAVISNGDDPFEDW